MTHQWFGNLVTPDWWSDLWLNEGFASYIEYLGVDSVEPTWKSTEQFVINEVQNVFSLDALSSSHQISIKVGNPDEINEIFDRISYGKGATIIRMMDHFLTSKVFTGGLTNYLKDRSYQSSEQDDLWQALTEEARRTKIFDDTCSVKEIMDTWTLQTGFPVLKVNRDYGRHQIKFEQERFFLINSTNSSKENPLWWIPITYTSRDRMNFTDTKPTYWLKATKNLTIQETIHKEDWVIVNMQQTGYYRVNYDVLNWKLISAHLKDKKRYQEIATSNRAQLIDDAMNLARAGYLDYSVALDVTRYMSHERDYIPWKALISSMNYIDSMLRRGPHYEYLKVTKSLIFKF